VRHPVHGRKTRVPPRAGEGAWGGGSDIRSMSCIRPICKCRCPPLLPTLFDGKPISSWGSIKKTLNFGARAFLCTFILAAVSKPILGVDFLAENRLLVDPHFGQVLDAHTLDPISGSESVSRRRSGLAASLCHVTPAVRSLLATFPGIVGEGSGTPNPKHGVFHSIETSGRPVFAKPRRLDPDR
jgi:hypothetical protein